MNNKSRINIFLSGILLCFSISAFLIYAHSSSSFSIFGYQLKKNKELIIPGILSNEKVLVKKNIKSCVEIKDPAKIIDTTPKRFLLIGDSQIEGLRNPFYDYCKKNGHELALAFIWYSSTDKTFGTNDTLKKLIATYKPNYIVFVIGLNQLYQTSFDESETSLNNILATFGKIPYSWIGPANWVADKGVNEFYKSHLESDKFFLSKDLILERAKDGRHPSNKACFVWMDSIANWMQNNSAWKIKMQKPDSIEKKRDFKVMTLTVGEN